MLTRLWGDDSDILKDKTKKAMGRRVMEFMPEDRPGDFNQALIELGATVCVPNGQPLCDQCPWDTVCKAYKEDLIDQLPVKTPKKARRIEHKTVFLLECGEQIAIHKRGDKGLLAGLWEFPNEDKKMDAEDIKEWMAEHHMECKDKSSRKGTYFQSCGMAHGRSKISLKTPIQSENCVWVLKRTRKYVCIAVSI
ncbi:MAG: NUDIX domain-containing protein [Mediterraneibacter faecis]